MGNRSAPREQLPGAGDELAARLKVAAPEWAKECIKPMMRAAGRATSAQRCLPDFLIVGTKRGGTTSLFRALQTHPALLPLWPGVANAKKTWFFDDHFDNGVDWYRGFFATERTRRRLAERLGTRVVTGEAAPYYMFHPCVPGRVARTLPQAKVVFILRNPVDRAWSHWNERRLNRTEPLDFAAALDAEPERLRGREEQLRSGAVRRSEPHDLFSYLARGCYAEQLRRWQALFPPAQLLVLRSEDLYADMVGTLVRVHAFLGIQTLPPFAPRRFNHVPATPMSSSLRARLGSYYRPRVDELEGLLGYAMNWQL